MSYVVCATDINTLETVYLLGRGFLFTPRLTEDCYWETIYTATDAAGLALVLNDNVTNIRIEEIVDN
jgi:hypothetical protein